MYLKFLEREAKGRFSAGTKVTWPNKGQRGCQVAASRTGEAERASTTAVHTGILWESQAGMRYEMQRFLLFYVNKTSLICKNLWENKKKTHNSGKLQGVFSLPYK
jgi:hypothetical protein